MMREDRKLTARPNVAATMNSAQFALTMPAASARHTQAVTNSNVHACTCVIRTLG